MSECLMCTIIARGPAFTFYDDDDFVAFLALHPLNRGHALLAPKLHVHWIWDHPRIGAYFELAARIATAMTKSFATDWITGVQLGADPPHAHTALVPRYEGDGHGSYLDSGLVEQFPEDEMSATARSIADAIV